MEDVRNMLRSISSTLEVLEKGKDDTKKTVPINVTKCRYPECKHVWKGKYKNTARHTRHAHLPWFASAHRHYNDLERLNGLVRLWISLLELLAELVVGRRSISALFRQVIQNRWYGDSPSQTNAPNARHTCLMEYLDRHYFKENAAVYDSRPPTCQVALIAMNVMHSILVQLTPEERESIALFKSDRRREFEERWKSGSSEPSKKRNVSGYETAKVTPKRARQEFKPMEPLTVVASHGERKVNVKPKQSMRIVDAHFH